MMLDEMGREVSFEDISARYRGHESLNWFLETRDLNDEEPRPRIIEGGLDVTHELRTSDGPWALIIDGDLVTTGDLVFMTEGAGTCALIVTGNVRARNISYGGSARVAVDGDITASGIITGSWGSDGAVLGTSGVLTARALLLDPHTPIWANAGGPRSVPEAFRTLIVGGTGWQEFVPDIDADMPENGEQTFVPEVLKNGMLDLYLARKHAERGGSPFLPEVERSLRAKKGL
ncbi:polymer-forming cytoskeletal protein [Cystobacter fuscus]|uniref:polymer-forming cytoskeletal protein n=1 Tax=Cystobacter fuscus TaxID=43 RepID=UPI002B29DEE5|nr:polymer-forming cytoskeletal protein [Cystobacter fuscus]